MPTVRITGGSLKGAHIYVLADVSARYTSSKVREAIFNMIGSVEGKSVLDLFAGSGLFSIEALSRGADSATLVEVDRKMVGLIKKNLAEAGLNKVCRVLTMDARRAISFLYGKGNVYDIIFLDPPYDKRFIADTMTVLERSPVLNADSLVIAEYSKREAGPFPDCVHWAGVTTKRYGDTMIAVLKGMGHSEI